MEVGFTIGISNVRQVDRSTKEATKGRIFENTLLKIKFVPAKSVHDTNNHNNYEKK